MFIDEARITAEGGRGGDGCVSFRREKYRPRGGPDGGRGGDGGGVVLVASRDRSTLGELVTSNRLRAENGRRGGPQCRTGAGGRNLEVPVPPGTVVRSEDGLPLADLVEPGQRFIAARGGRGGRGNAELAGRAGDLPRFAEKGCPGESRILLLEMRLVADVALVGFPNAGKSTLISRISRAKPKIADYPFTTTEPHLGAVEGRETEFIVTDVPGLVPGAHAGRGMGTAFLRHIERASVVVYLIDMSPMSGRRPVEDLLCLEEELGLYDPGLLERGRLAAANKMDLSPPEEALEELRRGCERREIELFPVSAVTGEGLPRLLDRMESMVKQARERKVDTGVEVTYSIGETNGALRVTRRSGRFVVTGKAVERLVLMTDWGSDEARAYLAENLRKTGVDEALRRAGAVAGDEVVIAGRAFEFIPDVGKELQDRRDGGEESCS